MDQDKKNMQALFLVLLIFAILLNIFDYMRVNELYSSVNPLYIKVMNAFSKLNKNIFLIRLFYLVMLLFTALLLPKWRVGKKPLEEKNKLLILMITLVLSLFILLGFSYVRFYNLIIYPLFFFAVIPFLTTYVTDFEKREGDEDFFKGVSNVLSDFFFEFYTEFGPMKIHFPQQATFIDGGNGSGKSHYVIKFILLWAAIKQYAGMVYDYEGDPTMEGSPLLSKIVISAIEEQRKIQPVYKLQTAFINFTDMTKTSRVNLLSERYFSNNSNSNLIITGLGTTLMKTLEPSWKEKTDFWASNAINYFVSINYLLYKNHRKEGLNTIPHAISISLEDCDTVFNWISKDAELSKMMASMLTAWKQQAQQQTAGAVSSAQLPLIKLFDKNIYWVLSKDELDLDVSNPKRPTLLCIGNSPDLKEAVGPAISCITSVVMRQMNRSGRVKSIFVIDELPTVNIVGLASFISTVRKHFVATVVAVQDYEQLVETYTKSGASIIRSNCGNYFQGMTSNMETASFVVKMLGKIKRTKLSHSMQDSGGGSVSDSLNDESVLQERDIASQDFGHFFMKVANGKPAFAYAQLEPFHLKNKIEIKDLKMNLIADVGDDEKNRYLMDCVVEANFQRINREAKELLERVV